MTDEEFRVRCHQQGAVYELKCWGSIDTAATTTMREATLAALSSRCRAIVIDVADVPLVDSAGLTSIRLAHKAAEIADVELRLTGANVAVMKLLRLADAEYLLGAIANAGT
jgi:anti-anti-sigma factor